MSFDGLMFKRVASLIKEKLENSFINKISQVNTTDFIFSLYKDKKLENLYVSTNNTSSFMAFINEKIEFDNLSNHFLSLLYHHIVGSRITNINQINNDRILKLDVSKRDELGIEHKACLYIELTGKLTNLIITKEDGTIIDALHRISPLSSRGVVSGVKYTLPTTQILKDPLNEYDPNLTLKEQFSCFSQSLLDEFNYRLEKNEKYAEILDTLLNSNTTYIYKNDYHIIELKHLNEEPIKCELNEGILRFNFNKHTSDDNALSKELLKIINRQIKHLKSKVTKLETELQNSSNAQVYQEYGDLIFTYCEELDKKAENIEICNGTACFLIKLDDSITVKENALKFYKKYQKLRNSKEAINEQISIAKSSLDYYQFLLIQLENKDKNNIEQIRDELIEQKVYNAQINSKKKNTNASFIHYEIDGFNIFVGKNNFQNEQLTLKKAKYNDYFFHVKDYSGSHVIVSGNKEISEKIIRFAANLAAYYSNARESSSVPVDYTLIRNVKRHPSNIPGKVSIKNYKTIYIDPVKPK